MIHSLYICMQWVFSFEHLKHNSSLTSFPYNKQQGEGMDYRHKKLPLPPMVHMELIMHFSALCLKCYIWVLLAPAKIVFDWGLQVKITKICLSVLWFLTISSLREVCSGFLVFPIIMIEYNNHFVWIRTIIKRLEERCSSCICLEYREVMGLFLFHMVMIFIISI